MGFLSYLRSVVAGRASLTLYNTLTKQAEEFHLPAGVKRVRMYNCGPTVYGVQHIGNLSMFVFTDILRRTLKYNDFEVKQVINITDVGHLSSDADAGEDKMTLGLQREGMALTLENMRALAEKYTSIFLEDLKKLNVHIEGVQFPRASDYVPAQIAMIKTLEEKGYAYKADDGVYFDTSHFSAYGALGGINLEGLKEGARLRQGSGGQSTHKRHITDFALWKIDAALGWESPWGKGFPGWHIECSAMIRATLGEKIDIHTGGIEHIPIHHNNEIAQSQCATGKKPLSRFWLHRAHIQMGGGKIAKSEGNVVYLSEIIERGFNPLALRYLFLGAHYRTNSNFSWEALGAAQNALLKLYEYYAGTIADGQNNTSVYIRRFNERINEDLDTPGALAVMWEMTKDDKLSAASKKEAVRKFDTVLGLDISKYLDSTHQLSPEVERLAQGRKAARESQNWNEADRLREKIESLGYSVKDTEQGPLITPRVQN